MLVIAVYYALHLFFHQAYLSSLTSASFTVEAKAPLLCLIKGACFYFSKSLINPITSTFCCSGQGCLKAG